MVGTGGKQGPPGGTQTAIARFSDRVYREQADFRCALRRFLHLSEERARASGITPQQHLLLLVVRGHRAHPQASIGDIADALQISPHGASLLVDRSVKWGLLDRQVDPDDRRRALLSLTPKGQRILDEITGANINILGTLGDYLSDPLWRGRHPEHRSGGE